jgi:ribosomal protein L24
MLSLTMPKAGREEAIVKAYFDGLSDFPDKTCPLISNAFERSAFIPRSIFVETSDVTSAIEVLRLSGIGGISTQPNIQLVPLEDRSALMNLGLRSIDVGSWVRVAGKGKYRMDMAHVLDVDEVARTAKVLLLPRISRDGRGKRKRATRIEPCIFDAKHLGSKVKRLENGGVMYKGETYRNGLLESTFPLNGLYAASPTASELNTFGRTRTIHPSVMKKSWAKWAAASIKQGDRVCVTSGEQAGMIGKVHDIAHDVATIFPVGGSVTDNINADTRQLCVDAPLTNIRLHLLVGDYVYVVFGANAGKSGVIVEVEEDLVTLVDGSAKTGQPEQVSLRSVLKYVIPNICNFFQISVPATFVRIDDRHNNQECIPVIVVGEHQFSGRRGVICGAAKWNANDGTVSSFWVKLQPDDHKVEVCATYIIHR